MVADRLASRLRLRPLTTDLDVFPPVAAPGRCAVGLFPLVVLRSPSGTHTGYRTSSPPARASWLGSGRPPMSLVAPSTISVRGIDCGESPVSPRWHSTVWGLAVHPKTVVDLRHPHLRGPALPDSRRVGCRYAGPLGWWVPDPDAAHLARSLRPVVTSASRDRLLGLPAPVPGKPVTESGVGPSYHPPGGFWRCSLPPANLPTLRGARFGSSRGVGLRSGRGHVRDPARCSCHTESSTTASVPPPWSLDDEQPAGLTSEPIGSCCQPSSSPPLRYETSADDPFACADHHRSSGEPANRDGPWQHGSEIPRRGFPGPLRSASAVSHGLDGLPLPGLHGLFQPLSSMGFGCLRGSPAPAATSGHPEGLPGPATQVVARRCSRRRPPRWPCARRVRGEPRGATIRPD
jgi:hypothetical protein